MTPEELIDLAKQVRKQAYAPYSHYKVGAALLGKSGKVYTGCNVENASYGHTVCAERTAVLKAVSEGEREFEAVAVVTKNGGSPCGACRQVLSEFAPALIVYIADKNGEFRTTTLKKLLPDSFTPAHLEAVDKKKGNK
jgi:cytidine deaminase